MARTTHTDLDRQADYINDALGITDEDEKYTIEWAYGAPSLVRKRQSVVVSGRMRSGLLLDWMQAFRDGIYAERQRRGED